MKQWQETTEILNRLSALTEEGKRAAVATVVNINGSAYRRAGAKLLIEESGVTLGGVSGGCLEADVREIALVAMRDGVPCLKHYDTGTDENMIWGLGLGCNGAVDVFVQPVTSDKSQDVLRSELELLDGDVPFAVGTVIAGDPSTLGCGLVTTGSGATSGSTGDAGLDRELEQLCGEQIGKGSSICDIGDGRVFVEVRLPPHRVMIFGAGEDARPLAAAASAVGFRVEVVDHRPAFLSRDRFPSTVALNSSRPEDAEIKINGAVFAVVMTHSLKHDTEWVRYLLSTDVSYIGMLGPRQRTEDILESVAGSNDDRIFGPVGVDIGADGPEQVAASIVAELLAVRAERQPRHLRERQGAINVR